MRFGDALDDREAETGVAVVNPPGAALEGLAEWADEVGG